MSDGRLQLVLSCEHGGNLVPARFAPKFGGDARTLDSHRGIDRGAAELSRDLVRRTGAPLALLEVTRLLVDANRSLDHPELISNLVNRSDPDPAPELIAHVWTPHRDAVRRSVDAALLAGERTSRVLHLGVHTFTPMRRGEQRRMDVAWLFDASRPLELELASTWRRLLAARRPDLRLAFNEPYAGTDDGLTTSLRLEYPVERYAGIELEVNQAFPRGSARRWQALIADLGDSLLHVLNAG